MNLAAICVGNPDNALIAAECSHLTGGEPDADGFAFCQQRGNYSPGCLPCELGCISWRTEQHWMTCSKPSNRQTLQQTNSALISTRLSRREWLRPRATIVALANMIPFHPNLDHPKHRFMIVEREHGLWFGEIVSECQRSYQQHDAKPYRTSTSLSSQLSRALVNLVYRRHSHWSIRAAEPVPSCWKRALGMQAYGADQNKRIVGMARENLAHFGYEGIVEQAEIQAYRRTADALVTDLPYGRLLDADESAIRRILEHGRNLAPVAVYVAGYNITEWLAAAGYRDIAVYTMNKHKRVVRYVHRAQGC